MRLIDSDKLIVEVERSGGYIRNPHFSIEQINCAETIDAIPIDWIKRKAFEHPSLSRNLFYRMIIEEWEKENGK